MLVSTHRSYSAFGSTDVWYAQQRDAIVGLTVQTASDHLGYTVPQAVQDAMRAELNNYFFGAGGRGPGFQSQIFVTAPVSTAYNQLVVNVGTKQWSVGDQTKLSFWQLAAAHPEIIVDDLTAMAALLSIPATGGLSAVGGVSAFIKAIHDITAASANPGIVTQKDLATQNAFAHDLGLTGGAGGAGGAGGVGSYVLPVALGVGIVLVFVAAAVLSHRKQKQTTVQSAPATSLYYRRHKRRKQ